jgi:hypothetical protein
MSSSARRERGNAWRALCANWFYDAVTALARPVGTPWTPSSCQPARGWRRVLVGPAATRGMSDMQRTAQLICSSPRATWRVADRPAGHDLDADSPGAPHRARLPAIGSRAALSWNGRWETGEFAMRSYGRSAGRHGHGSLQATQQGRATLIGGQQIPHSIDARSDSYARHVRSHPDGRTLGRRRGPVARRRGYCCCYTGRRHWAARSRNHLIELVSSGSIRGGGSGGASPGWGACAPRHPCGAARPVRRRRRPGPTAGVIGPGQSFRGSGLSGLGVHHMGKIGGPWCAVTGSPRSVYPRRW